MLLITKVTPTPADNNLKSLIFSDALEATMKLNAMSASRSIAVVWEIDSKAQQPSAYMIFR